MELAQSTAGHTNTSQGRSEAANDVPLAQSADAFSETAGDVGCGVTWNLLAGVSRACISRFKLTDSLRDSAES